MWNSIAFPAESEAERDGLVVKSRGVGSEEGQDWQEGALRYSSRFVVRLSKTQSPRKSREVSESSSYRGEKHAGRG